MSKGRSRQALQALAPQGTIALWSQTSHGKWQLQEMFDLLCEAGQLPQEESASVCLSPEVQTDGVHATDLSRVETEFDIDFPVCM